MSHKPLIREVFPEGESTTYRELAHLHGRVVQIHISRSREMRHAHIELWANDSWRPVVSLAPAKPEPHVVSSFQTQDSFQAERDELVRRFGLVVAQPGGGPLTPVG